MRHAAQAYQAPKSNFALTTWIRHAPRSVPILRQTDSGALTCIQIVRLRFMKEFYQVQIDHGDYWSETCDVLAASPRLAAMFFLQEIAMENHDWCCEEYHSVRVKFGGGEWEHYQLRARLSVVVEDYADKPNDHAQRTGGA